MKLIIVLFLLIPFLLFSSYPADAAKKPTPTPKKSSKTVKKPTPKPQPSKKIPAPKKSIGKSSGTEKITGSDVVVAYKVQGSSLVVTFSNLKNTSSVSYTLIYATNGQQEGAMGTIYPKGANTASRQLLFGTCSKNVCRYHTNVSNVTLEISVKLKSGKTLTKSYPIAY